MLASKNRLKRRINFTRVEVDGRMIQSKSFGMVVYDRSGGFEGESSDTDSRFGFIVSTKISKKANVRNRIKRIIADAVKENLIKIKKGLDVVFLIKPNALKTRKEDLIKEVYEIIAKNIQSNSFSRS